MTERDRSDGSHRLAPGLTFLNDADLQLLLALARLGRLLPRHINRVWYPHLNFSTVCRRLRRLRQVGLINAGNVTVRRPTPGTFLPLFLGKLYMLTELGEALIKDRFPEVPFEVERVVVQKGNILWQAEHQIDYADLMVDVLTTATQTIPGLVGVYSETEVRLGPSRVPRCDGLLLVRRWNTPGAADEGPLDLSKGVPWVTRPRRAREQTERTFAVEIDRDTEPAAVIEQKAVSYREVFESGWWKGRYRFPIPLFVVPTAHRQQVILREWQRGWPQGRVLVTTKPELDQHGVNAPIWIDQKPTGRTYRALFQGLLDPILAEEMKR